MNVEKCIKCDKCKGNCEYLKKNDIDLSELKGQRPDLCYGCLLCGECGTNCPAGIDGRELVLELREKNCSEGKLEKKPYRSVIFEKKNYLFKNYSGGNKETVLFPGCNFPSFLPGTTIKLIGLLKDKLDAGVVFDCCGKPIAELGMKAEAEGIVGRINKSLAEAGVKKLITVCPNCYYFLKDKLNVEVSDIYSELLKLGIRGNVVNHGYNVFVPCPDRKDRLMLDNISKLLGNEARLDIIQGIQCCGLGGLSICTDRNIPDKLMEKLKEKELDTIHTYCATCYGNFYRNGIKEPRHFLADILEVEETFPKGIASLLNRAAFKFKKFI